MGRIAAGIEYDGAAFHGWQRQSHATSVQEVVEAALGGVADSPVELTCAGRTDAGVHARGQVVHFDTSAERSPRAWLFGANSELPPAVNLRWVQPVAEDFHARYGATRRTYRYVLLNQNTRSALAAGRALVVYRPLDLAAMQAAAADLVGEHDFSAFRAAQCQARSPVRRIDALQVRRREAWVVVEVSANAFLHHMVRNIVGTLLAVGLGDAPVSRAREQLDSRRRATGEATVAAHGLYLWQVEYPPRFGLPADSAMIDALEAAGN
ncbi:MAG: tRNA pseudouridine(38-40) synthase TruA [Gammaproteobacteria bacterium]|nr:tRNA pseudouridine(38-40) synthase TruA [Gammaproteobacteria bacterium]MDE2252098.1 tRNA pseudouridine(38-40) synthase TruA [Gammaproteobacteria bacterium]